MKPTGALALHAGACVELCVPTCAVVETTSLTFGKCVSMTMSDIATCAQTLAGCNSVHAGTGGLVGARCSLYAQHIGCAHDLCFGETMLKLFCDLYLGHTCFAPHVVHSYAPVGV